MPCRGLPLPQESSLLSVLESVRAPCWRAKLKHDLGPQSGPCESFLYSLWFESFAIRCYMSSWSFLEHEEFSLLVSILDQTLARGRPQLEPFGLAGVVTVKGIAEALFIPNLFLVVFTISSSSGICPIFRTFICGFALWTFWHIWVFFWPDVVLLWPVSSWICLWTRIYASGGFPLSSWNRVPPIHGWDIDVSPSMFQEWSMVDSWSTSRLVIVCPSTSMEFRGVGKSSFATWCFVLGATCF